MPSLGHVVFAHTTIKAKNRLTASEILFKNMHEREKPVMSIVVPIYVENLGHVL